MELLSHKNNRRSKSESICSSGGGGSGRDRSDGDGSVQQRKREEYRNPEMDPHLRVMERFRELYSHSNKDGITCPDVVDSREICIKFN